MKKSFRIRNQKISSRAVIDETVVEHVDKKVLRLLGHYQRMEKERWPWKIEKAI